MIDNEKLLFDELYEKTKDCGRVQFVKLLMTKERENQELKQKYLNAVADYESVMFEKGQLKKQLEKKQNPLQGIFSQVNDDMLLRDCGAMQFEIDEYKTQQKEFIEYMNKTIEELECDDVDDEEMKGYLIQRIDTFKEILRKYKSIIGDDK